MSHVEDQVHHKFKLFSGGLDADGTLGTLEEEVAAWARSAGVAPKSIGVEYIESAQRVILSVGYRDDEPSYPIALTSVPVGPIEGFGAEQLATLEKAMAAAAGNRGHIICHELYVTAKNHLLMVFMSHAV